MKSAGFSLRHYKVIHYVDYWCLNQRLLLWSSTCCGFGSCRKFYAVEIGTQVWCVILSYIGALLHAGFLQLIQLLNKWWASEEVCHRLCSETYMYIACSLVLKKFTVNTCELCCFHTSMTLNHTKLHL